MTSGSYRREVSRITRAPKSGDQIAAFPQSWIDRKDEVAIVIQFLCDRKLFGLAYWMLQPDYFDQMPRDSGVLLSPFLQTQKLFPEAKKPGDIDLLIIPYEQSNLILDRAMAVEFKIIRASFEKQSKSPNDFGYSQARALVDLGFPYVTVAHLIVSDRSPALAWRTMTRGRVLNEEGHVGEIEDVSVDWMPSDLIDRAIGRLESNTPVAELGLLASYLPWPNNSLGEMWVPSARAAKLNTNARASVLDAVADFYRENPFLFLNTPRWDPK